MPPGLGNQDAASICRLVLPVASPAVLTVEPNPIGTRIGLDWELLNPQAAWWWLWGTATTSLFMALAAPIATRQPGW
jgi:hypothetical protein